MKVTLDIYKISQHMVLSKLKVFLALQANA